MDEAAASLGPTRPVVQCGNLHAGNSTQAWGHLAGDGNMANVMTHLFSIVLIEVYAVPLCCYSW